MLLQSLCKISISRVCKPLFLTTASPVISYAGVLVGQIWQLLLSKDAFLSTALNLSEKLSLIRSQYSKCFSYGLKTQIQKIWSVHTFIKLIFSSILSFFIEKSNSSGQYRYVKTYDFLIREPVGRCHMIQKI